MTRFLGEVKEDSTVDFFFTTNNSSGAAVAPSSAFEAADLAIYKDNSATQKTSTNGVTMTSPFDSVTGLHHVRLDTSNDTGDAGFWVAGSDYTVVLNPDETVDSQTVVAVLAQFSIENRLVTNVYSDTTIIHSDTVVISSDTAVIESDTTAIHSDTTIIASDVVIIGSDTAKIESDTAVIESDTTAIHSDTTIIHSDTIVISSDTAVIESDTTALQSGVNVTQVSGSAAAADNMETLFDGNEGFASAYAGPMGPGVYCDDAAANTSTTSGVDGTWANPVSTLGAARTIADAIGVKCYYILGRSSFTLTATHQDWNFIGLGGFNDNTLNLGTAAAPTDVDGSVCHRLRVVGTMSGSDRLVLVDCAIDDAPAAEVTTINVLAVRCTLEGDFALDSSADHVFDQCVSGIAGNSAPVVTFNASGGSAMFRSYSGGIELKSLVASNTVSVETDGQVIFNADCNVNATVVCRGMMTITDNTAGMSNLTTDAVYDKRSQITTIASDLVLVYSDTAAIHSETTVIQSDTAVIESDTTAIHSDTTIIASDVVLIYSDTAAIHSDTTIIHSDTVVISSDTAVIESDTTAIHSDTTIIHSDTIVISSDTAAIHSDTTIIASDVVIVVSDTTAIHSETTALQSGVNVTQINSNSDAATALALSADTIVVGTVDTTAHTPTTTEFEADDITEATDDHWNGRVIIWTSGALQNQATDITDYTLTGGRGHFTVTSMTEAPSNNDTFVIV